MEGAQIASFEPPFLYPPRPRYQLMARILDKQFFVFLVTASRWLKVGKSCGLEREWNGRRKGGKMTSQNVALGTIEDFLAQKRIAVVGISRQPKSFSAALFKEVSRRGYDVVPVNPRVSEVAGRRCFARVQDIQPPVDGALLMTSPEITDAVVKDCAAAGIRRVWMYRAGGRGGAVSPQAVQFCQERGMQVIAGQCPFMFWRDAGALHRLHGFIRKITGHYPRQAPMSERRAA